MYKVLRGFPAREEPGKEYQVAWKEKKNHRGLKIGKEKHFM